MTPDHAAARAVLDKITPGPWWTDAKYRTDDIGCVVLAARTDAGPLPGNPTRGIVAVATELLPEHAARCGANARAIAALPEAFALYRADVRVKQTWAKVLRVQHNKPGDHQAMGAAMHAHQLALDEQDAALAAVADKLTGEGK